MSAVAQVQGLTKRYGTVTAVDDVSFRIEEGKVYGLLGRNGAGKTTIMSMLTGQDVPSEGSIEVFGADPFERRSVLEKLCFIRESQRYPDDFRPSHVLTTSAYFFPGWDAELAARLVEDFRLPVDRRIKKLSRGQLSAVGVIVGLASRAPLTFFDEPYLGLDAVARQLFYDRLLADIAEHPRTVVLSTHLIDEVGDLLEHILMVDDGRLVLDADADTLRGSATSVAGPRSAVDAFVGDREVLHREGLGSLAAATVGRLSAADREAAVGAGLDLSPVSLQQLVVRLTGSASKELAR
ncbi:ABC transporter ATP-binding protein [Xylanimonas protaetiae]|uniref:ABC transporter ATP-binding protein n=1 Tax=Xylanimonas protaetiae TaxID=2509457 RepID=A0A4V0YG06_9MICO|nr:ABC transporter ATP-binding protein [Xylanimonas protaetiae]QAY69541.1 ABC transporter ATP-binding protein [Xylanimonas protaetiae]